MAASRVKKPSKAQEDEHMALEDAMQELVRQTDALLSDTSTHKEPPKPRLPKTTKKVIPHNKGAHLDIVGHAPSTIKRSQQADKGDQETELLEAHAGKSYNEVSASGNNEVSASGNNEATSDSKTIVTEAKISPARPDPSSATKPAIIKPHESSTLATPSEKEVKEPKQLPQAGHIAVVDTSKQQSVKTTIAHPSSKDASVHKETEETPQEPLESKEDKGEPTLAVKSETPGSGITFGEGKQKENGDLAAQKTSSANVQTAPEKPHTFDTNEYHPELHDWSKLSSSNHWSVFILLFLVALAGGLAYLYFAGLLPQL